MYLGCSTTRKSLSLIIVKYSFHQITRLGMTRSFLKGKPVRKGSPKQKKFRADIIKTLDDLKESKNGVFEGYSENHNWTHKSCL
jgi:hypothetical protein